jgi:hypothetical protein
MGRTLKRVPMDFNWPLDKIWEGYLNPYYGKECPACKGYGHNEATHKIDEEWYAFDSPSYSWLDSKHTRWYNDNAHCYHLTQVEVDALLAHDRLRSLKEKLGRDPTVDEVNQWAIHDPIDGHDSINRWTCVEARDKELGVYGLCPTCGGEGRLWESPVDKQKYEAWDRHEPPVGTGFQLWETTTEGSPQSPVFATLEELAAWCEENATVFGEATASAEEWLKMLAEDNVHLREGTHVFI